jgi:nicotinamidase-related amidase
MKKKILIVVDMQNDFVDGSLGSPEARAIILNVKEKINEYRFSNENYIYYTQDTHYENYLDTLEGQKLPVKHCIHKTEGWEITPRLTIDLRVNGERLIKETFGYTGWENLLGEEDEIGHIELVGLCTDICVISNALILRALYPNTRIFVDSKCCAGTTPEKHEAALKVMESCQIDVI